MIICAGKLYGTKIFPNDSLSVKHLLMKIAFLSLEPRGIKLGVEIIRFMISGKNSPLKRGLISAI